MMIPQAAAAAPPADVASAAVGDVASAIRRAVASLPPKVVASAAMPHVASAAVAARLSAPPRYVYSYMSLTGCYDTNVLLLQSRK